MNQKFISDILQFVLKLKDYIRYVQSRYLLFNNNRVVDTLIKLVIYYHL